MGLCLNALFFSICVGCGVLDLIMLFLLCHFEQTLGSFYDTVFESRQVMENRSHEATVYALW